MFKSMTKAQLEKHVNLMENLVELDTMLTSLAFKELSSRYNHVETEEDRQRKAYQEKRVARRLEKARKEESERRWEESKRFFEMVVTGKIAYCRK